MSGINFLQNAVGLVDDLSGVTDAAAARRNLAVDLARILRPEALRDPEPVMSSPPTLGALSTTTAIASPRLYRTGPQTAAAAGELDCSWFTTTVGGPLVLAGTSYPDHFFVKGTAPATGAGSTYQRVEFTYDGAGALEIYGKGNGGKVRVWVNDELVSATPTTLTADGSGYFLPVTFSGATTARIAVEGSGNWFFGGINVGATDSVWPGSNTRPSVLVIGDSFTEGAGATAYGQGWVPLLGNIMGWNTWAAGQGGSGYASPGSYTGKFASRVTFYESMTWDAIIVSGGINDSGSYTAQVATEAAALFASLQSTFPGVPIIATSPLLNKGVEAWGSHYQPVRDAIRTAATAAGVFFVDVMEMPLDGQTYTPGTLAAGAASGASTISCSRIAPVGSIIEIGTGAAGQERRRITGFAGGGPFTLTVSPTLTNNHSNGETVTHVGQCLWTGTGKVGGTTGTGNCDRYVSADGTHPSDAGHRAIARAVADMICTQVIAAIS